MDLDYSELFSIDYSCAFAVDFLQLDVWNANNDCNWKY